MRAAAVARLLLIAAAAQTAGQAPAPDQVLSVDVLVTDQQDRPVPGLQNADFQIVAASQEGVVQSVSIGRTPLEIVLLLDLTASISTTLQRRVLEEDVDRAVIYALQEGERLRIGSFSRRLILTPGLTSDVKRLRDALRTAMAQRGEDSYGPSPIWDSTLRAMESFSATGARRAVILITDGRSTGNVHSVADVARAAMLRGVAIHIVGQDLEVLIDSTTARSVAVRPGKVLAWLADVTGGQFISATAMDERPAVPLTTILRSLRQTYTVTFTAPVRGEGPHTLVVGVRRAGVKVRARSVFAEP